MNKKMVIVHGFNRTDKREREGERERGRMDKVFGI
jgi:hypothetical protein